MRERFRYFEELTTALNNLATTQKEYDAAQKAHSQAAVELTAAEKILVSAQADLGTAVAKIAGLRNEETVLRSVPEVIYLSKKEVERRGLKDKVRRVIENKAFSTCEVDNPDLPAAKQKLTELKIAVDRAVSAETAAKEKVTAARLLAISTRTVAEAAQRKRDDTQAKVKEAATKVKTLRGAQKTAPVP